MSEQITLDESVFGVSSIKVDEGIENPQDSLNKDTTVICGSCGASMRRMGPSDTTKQSYDNMAYDHGVWQFSCRACGSGSAKVKLNPVPPMLEFDDDDYFGNSGGNFLTVETGVGHDHQLVPSSSLELRNGYHVHPDTFDEEEHEDIDPPSTEADLEQMKIFQY